MCRAHPSRKVGPPRRVVTKDEFSPEAERAFQWMLDEYRSALDPVEDQVDAFLAGASEDDVRSLEAIRGDLETRFGSSTADFETVFREGGEDAARAGREIAARRHSLDIAFDVVPERTLETIDDWVETAAGSTLETITDESAQWIRGAHREGLSIDDIASQVNELYDDRLEDYVARRAARTATVSTSNAGNHSAHEDADGVIGEQWITGQDGRQRDSHDAAHGQVVAVDQSFEVGGSYLSHPGDPTAPVGELANCRCVVVPVFADHLTESQLETVLDGGRITIAPV